MLPSNVKGVSYSRSFKLPNGELETVTIQLETSNLEEVDFVNLREQTSPIVAQISEAYEHGLVQEVDVVAAKTATKTTAKKK